jgi:D-serine deaminase-like pyridoxal phosphate-dependent protein
MATVISKPSVDRAVIDAGNKSLTVEPRIKRKGFINSYGYVKDYEGVRIVSLSEEYGVLQLEEVAEIKVGDILEIIPNHVFPAVNLFDKLNIIESDELIAEWDIEAKG